MKKSQYINDTMIKHDIHPWLERWKDGQIAFHQPHINEDLINYVQHNQKTLGEHVLVPLCGKSKDMLYLMQQGYQVTGIEVSQLAIEDFFQDHDIPYKVEAIENGKRYHAPNIQILEKNFFDIHAKDFRQNVDWIYDRAALIALSKKLRKSYVEHIETVAQHAQHILCISMEKIEDEITGPPFAVPEDEIKQLYANWTIPSMTRTQKSDVLSKTVYHFEKL